LSESAELTFPVDHPTAAGHFPGNPILPGALLLDAIVLAVSRGMSMTGVTIQSAKFLRPVRPGDTLRVTWDSKGADTYFSGALASGEIAVSGVLRLGHLRPGHQPE
jgi:3-hydroxymyristoyl/3-hydroxydecanoyl-(acyl carrier protein) dehydratase